MTRRFIDFKEMVARGYFSSRPACARAIAAGFIPPPHQLGPNTLKWDEDEVEEFDRSRPRGFPKTPGYTPKKAVSL